MKIVHDVTDYQLHFFAIPTEREPDKRSVLCEFLNAAVADFAKAIGKDPPYRLQLDSYRHRVSDRLAIVHPTPSASGHILELDVRTLHDAIFLRASALRRGPLKLEQLNAHRCAFPLPVSDKALPNYLGALRVFYVESDEQKGDERATSRTSPAQPTTKVVAQPP